MWVLIVSAFRGGVPTPEEARELSEFESALQEGMAAQSKAARIDCRSIGELDDLVFAPRWGYSEDKALVAFDHLDMVFFRGSTAVLPWFKSARNVRAPACVCIEPLPLTVLPLILCALVICRPFC